MTMAELRDLLGTTRKYAVPIGEYLDRIGLTRREGDVRRLGPTALGDGGRVRSGVDRHRPFATCPPSTPSSTAPSWPRRSRGSAARRPCGRSGAAIDEARGAARPGRSRVDVDPGAWPCARSAILDGRRPALRPVLNATGILLHTGLGRAPLAAEAVEAVAASARGYCNLEFDLDTGERGRRTVGRRRPCSAS